MPTNTYSPYFAPGHLVPALLGPDPSSVASPLSHAVVPQGVQVAQQKIPRSDRLEVSFTNYDWHKFFNFVFFLQTYKYKFYDFYIFKLIMNFKFQYWKCKIKKNESNKTKKKFFFKKTKIY